MAPSSNKYSTTICLSLLAVLEGDFANKIELLAATTANGPIAKFLEKKGEGIHHVAFEVEDIFAEMERLKAEGFTLLNEKPKKGADNKLVAFVHPKTANGVLVELCQEIVK